MFTVDMFTCITSIAAFVSLILVWLTTKANNGRKRKELTILYTDSHEMNTEELLKTIHGVYKNGSIDIEKVKNNAQILGIVEKYLFCMERLSVGINTNILDINIFDRVMGKKTLEHFDALKPYIIYIRKEDYERKYEEFEILCEKIRKIRKKRFQVKQPTNGNIGKVFN